MKRGQQLGGPGTIASTNGTCLALPRVGLPEKRRAGKPKMFPEESSIIYVNWVVPPPRMPVANEGLGWNPLLKM